MKKQISASILCTALLILGGCKGEAEAREYAKGLMEVLKTYEAELQGKTAAEQKAYRALAAIYSGAADSNLLASLNTDRKERGDRLADQSISRSTPRGSALQDDLKDYASREIDATHELLTRESDNYDKYLSSLNKLSVDADAVEQAVQAMEVLTEKPSLLGELKFIKDFGVAAKSCLDELTCKSLSDQLASAKSDQSDSTKALERAEDEKARQARLQATMDGLVARQKQAGCDKKPVCPKD
ncbi:hypothetical protein [uncultured Paludibaculum sp.]|uniref:hypothetical protein n=1 Tax=uncultured Paludibaculum sp. TaxID=1765020 RepID=UPI002AAC0D63|nr:hypothetical protein [uncultured Paludibaculum sp.]